MMVHSVTFHPMSFNVRHGRFSNSGDARTWGDAQTECSKRTSDLVSIHSDVENKAVRVWANNQNVWSGLRRNGWGEYVQVHLTWTYETVTQGQVSGRGWAPGICC